MTVALKNLACVAAEIGCTARWLGDQVRAGRFPARKIGRRWMFTDTDIVAILEICSVSPHACSNNNHLGPVTEAKSSMTPTTRRRLQRSSQYR
jgi:hypothetical protein